MPARGDGVDVMALAQDERADLAALLAGLDPAQWDAPTLCAGWRVRDVVGHVFGYDEIGVFGTVRRFVAGGFSLHRANALGIAADAERSPDELLARIGRHLRPRGITTMFGGRIALTDALIHHQDIRRPLGMPREIPADRLRTALDFARTAPPLGAAKRIAGLTLTATDLDWAAGSGPVVEAPAEALLLAMAGRDTTAELAGPGAPILAGRFSG